MIKLEFVLYNFRQLYVECSIMLMANKIEFTEVNELQTYKS